MPKEKKRCKSAAIFKKRLRYSCFLMELIELFSELSFKEHLNGFFWDVKIKF